MSTPKSSKGLIWTAILSAIAASLCCITPILAFIAGAGGAASAFSWIEPARPYLIGITVLVLGFAWYQKIKPKKTDVACYCEAEKPSFIQSKTFLGIVTVFAALMLAFPYYSHIFYPKSEAKAIVVESQNIQQVNLEIDGMTCGGCANNIHSALSKKEGILENEVKYPGEVAIVKYDPEKITEKDIIATIEKIGYKAEITTEDNNEKMEKKGCAPGCKKSCCS